MTGASALACVLLAFGYFRPRAKQVINGFVTYAALYVVAVLALPFLFQTFVVKPNELSLETPYLNHYIAFTRTAYKLDGIQETAYPALSDLTPDVIARNQDTIQNIRLWDSRPLLQTYQQTQAIRLYYEFYNVNVDRYHLADGFHQVMLSPRELASQLPAHAQTWVNENLEFTHGEGMVMNFVSTSTGGGLPQYLLENIPARISVWPEYLPSPQSITERWRLDTRSSTLESKSSTIPRAMRTFIRAIKAQAEFHWTAFGRGSCLHGRRRTSTFLLTGYLEAAKQNSDLEGSAGARFPSCAFPASGQGAVRRRERREAVLDSGRVYRLGSLPLFECADRVVRRKG